MRVAIIPARGGSVRIPRKNIRDFMGKPIMVLGPCHRFAPYDDPCYGAPTLGSNYQLMCEGEEGRFITFGSGVEVNGRRLCTRIPPRRPKPFLGWLP